MDEITNRINRAKEIVGAALTQAGIDYNMMDWGKTDTGDPVYSINFNYGPSEGIHDYVIMLSPYELGDTFAVLSAERSYGEEHVYSTETKILANSVNRFYGPGFPANGFTMILSKTKLIFRYFLNLSDKGLMGDMRSFLNVSTHVIDALLNQLPEEDRQFPKLPTMYEMVVHANSDNDEAWWSNYQS